MAPRTPRSKFLSEALRSYETSDSQALLDLANDFLSDTAAEEVESLSAKDNEILNNMAAKLREAHGEKLNSRRLLLSSRRLPDMPKIMMDHLGHLSPEGRQKMVQAYIEVLSRPKETNQTACNGTSEVPAER